MCYYTTFDHKNWESWTGDLKIVNTGTKEVIAAVFVLNYSSVLTSGRSKIGFSRKFFFDYNCTSVLSSISQRASFYMTSHGLT